MLSSLPNAAASSVPAGKSHASMAQFPLIEKTHTDDLPASVPQDHACIQWAKDMAVIHNTMIRALNASYNHCLSIKPGTTDAADFLLFNRTFFDFLYHHHTAEEEFVFPQLEKLLGTPGAMETNVAQHHAFEPGLKKFEAYITKTPPDKYCGETLKQIIESFAEILVEHLHDEIPTLLTLHALDSTDLDKIWKRAQHEATKDGSLFVDVPWLLSCQDRTFLLDGEARPFPDIGSVLPLLISAFFGRRNAGAWRFGPSSFTGWPKPLTLSS